MENWDAGIICGLSEALCDGVVGIYPGLSAKLPLCYEDKRTGVVASSRPVRLLRVPLTLRLNIHH